MRKSATSMAEAQFAATQKKAKRALTEIEKERQEIAKRTAKLRALRLAKEAADKQAAEEAAAAKPRARKKSKPKATKKPSRPPRVY